MPNLDLAPRYAAESGSVIYRLCSDKLSSRHFEAPKVVSEEEFPNLPIEQSAEPVSADQSEETQTSDEGFGRVLTPPEEPTAPQPPPVVEAPKEYFFLQPPQGS